jgi:hypothetical protein
MKIKITHFLWLDQNQSFVTVMALQSSFLEFLNSLPRFRKNDYILVIDGEHIGKLPITLAVHSPASLILVARVRTRHHWRRLFHRC